MLLVERITNALWEEELAMVKPFVKGGVTSQSIGGTIKSFCRIRVCSGKGRPEAKEMGCVHWQRSPDFISKPSLSQTRATPITTAPFLPDPHSI